MTECRQIAVNLLQTIKHRFPNLLSSFGQLPDTRKPQGKQYSIKALMLGGLFLFLLKEGSRNKLNNNRKDGNFSRHYHQLFGMELSHADTVNDVLCELDSDHLDQLKMDMMSQLFEQKWLRSYRLLGKYYLVAVDATGVMSFDERHCPHCLTKTTNKGKKTEKTTYFHYVLEAKLVTSDGFAFSLASEWIENPEGDFEKQDCERKAFKRLAAKLKKQYPRLPICILADGLYPYEDAFKTCEEYGWKFIFVLQDSSLKSVQKKLPLVRNAKPATTFSSIKKEWYTTCEYRYQTNIKYHEKYTINWVQCIQKRKKISKPNSKTPEPEPKPESKPESKPSCFEYVTNIQPDNDNVRDIATCARLRWKIENEGFNTQKNGGYELEHKFCRKSYNGLKNYYTILQIAHAINQLIEKGECITRIVKQRPKETLLNIWEKFRNYMIFNEEEIIDHDNPVRPAPD